MGRFSRKGIAKFHFVPTIANLNGPTVAEITAGEDITPDIAEVSGFEFANSPIVTPDLATTFSPQISGEDVAAESSITFYERDDSTTIMAALAKGADGYVVIFPKSSAIAAAAKVEVWPVTVASNSRQYTAENEAAKFRVVFSVTAVPDQDSTVAA